MKVFFYLVLTASGLASLCAADFAIGMNQRNSEHWAVRDEETIRKTLTLSGAPMRLVVDNISGYVHVTAVNSGSEVRVVAHKTIRADADADLQQARSEVKLSMTEKPGSVSVYYDAPWRCNNDSGGCHNQERRFYTVSFDIDVEVPRTVRPFISTVNNGDVRVDGTTGDFDISDINGGITLTSISGSGNVHTINGPVSVRFAKNPSGPTSFKSINGPLDVYFQPDFSADLQFKTFNGQIYSDFDVVAGPVPTSSPEQRDGKFVYRSNALKGARVGRGGPALHFDTLNGNIRLHRAGQASTTHGFAPMGVTAYGTAVNGVAANE